MSKANLFSFYTILAIVFFGFFGLSMPYLIFPSLFLDPSHLIVPAHLDSFRTILLGITLAAYPFGQFIGSPILGALSDDFGRKNIIAQSLAVSSIASIISAFSLLYANVYLLIFSRLVAGLMEGNISIARAYVSDIKSIDKHMAFGKINACASIAYLIGPMVGAFIADKSIYPIFSIHLPFFCISALFMILSLFSFLLLKDTSLPQKGAEDAKIKKSPRNLFPYQMIKEVFSYEKIRITLLVVTLHTLAVDILYEFGPVYLTTKWGMSPKELAIYNSIVCISLALGAGFLCHRINKSYQNFSVIKTSMVLFMGTLISLAFMPYKWGLCIIYALFGISISLVNTNLTVLLSNSASDNMQGKVLGTQTSLRVLGDAIICLLGGILLTVTPYVLMVFSAVISFSSPTLLKKHQKIITIENTST